MSLRFFADHCVPSSMIRMLREAGHEVLQLKDFIPKDSADQVVISKAQELDAILLSLDSDFADIVTYPPTRYKGIVAVQVRNRPETMAQLLETLRTHLAAHDDQKYYSGKLLLAEVHRIRSRG